MTLKPLLLASLALLLASCGDDDLVTVNVDCLPPNLQAGVLAFYPFNGGSLADETSNANDLTNPSTAQPSTDRNGNASCAYAFNNTQNSGEFLTAANASFLNGLDRLTISLWYQPLDSTRPGGKYETLLGRGDERSCSDNSGQWAVGLFDCRRAVFGYNTSVWADFVTGLTDGCDGEVTALTDRWHHVVAIKDGADYSIYFNGTLQEQDSNTDSCVDPNLGEVFIGADFTGRIDDILLYNRALSAAEVTELFNLTACCE